MKGNPTTTAIPESMRASRVLEQPKTRQNQRRRIIPNCPVQAKVSHPSALRNVGLEGPTGTRQDCSCIHECLGRILDGEENSRARRHIPPRPPKDYRQRSNVLPQRSPDKRRSQLKENGGQRTALLNSKARVLADLYLYTQPDSLLVDTGNPRLPREGDPGQVHNH